MNYLPFLIKVGQTGAYTDNMVYEEPFDTKEAFGLWVKHVPFSTYPQVKSPVMQSWADEDGDDVYLPTSGIKCEAFDFPVDFVYYWNDGMANVRIAQFIERIKGKWLKVYDIYTKLCYKGVYVTEFDSDPQFRRRGMHDEVILRVTFKVNFPTFNETF